MKQYLLSVYQPDGGTPAPEFLEKVMRDVNALRQEMQAAGALPADPARARSCEESSRAPAAARSGTEARYSAGEPAKIR